MTETIFWFQDTKKSLDKIRFRLSQLFTLVDATNAMGNTVLSDRLENIAMAIQDESMKVSQVISAHVHQDFVDTQEDTMNIVHTALLKSLDRQKGD